MKSFKSTNNLVHWKIDCFGLGASTNTKRGVKGLKIALIHSPFNTRLRWLATKSKRRRIGVDHWLCTFYHVTSRDARSCDYDITKVNRITWTCLLTRVYTYAPIPGDQAFLKITAFDGLFFNVQNLFKIKIGKEEIKNPFHAV